MKILFDMQGAQCQSRHRGIGRYTLDLAKALGPLMAGRHDLHFAFNARLDEATDAIIAALDPHANAKQRLVVPSLVHVAAREAGNETRRQAAEMLVRYAMGQTHPDVVWYSSVIEGYIDDAVIPEAAVRSAHSVATLYDLIPLHDPHVYLGHPRVDAWYHAKLKALSQCDLLLAISDWVREDAVNRLGIDPRKVITIGSGVDPRFCRPNDLAAAMSRVSAAHGLTRPYVLYSGGLDDRKNVPRLIHAYAALPTELRKRHPLVIVGKASTEQAFVLNSAVRRSGLAPSDVVFTGYIPDEMLIDLYACCALFVFPSLMEGFGLPPLEAMACGAPVIASNTTSLPEVVGSADALFDPASIESISTKMEECLEQPARLDHMREYGLRRASLFTWRSVAERALHAIEALGPPAKQPSSDIAKESDRPSLLFLHALKRPPSVDHLFCHHRVITEKLPDSVSKASHALTEHLYRADRIVYAVHSEDRWQLVPWLQLRPGVAWLTTSENPSTRSEDVALLYQCGGYAACLASHMPPLGFPWETCVGLIACKEVQDLAPIGVPMATLPDEGEHASSVSTVVEAWYGAAWQTRENELLAALADSVAGDLDEDELARVSDGIVTARPPSPTTQWLVDVSQIARSDIGTGVQRVVRSILLRWLASPPPGVRIEPIAFVDGSYRYARRYSLGLLGLDDGLLEDDVVHVLSGDVFVGLDWSAETMVAVESLLRDWHRRGVGMHFVVHDLLPISLPSAFHPFARDLFIDWLRRVASVADSLHCVSRATAADMVNWLAKGEALYQFGRAPKVQSFHLGVEIAAPPQPTPLPSHLATAMSQRPTLLMVGTLEPRKGHMQALEAVDRLWAWGQDLNLVIVGHYGWMVEALVKRLDEHPERNLRLHWLNDADDGLLEALYASATVLLAPSLGEGYGLPLVEAAHRGLPIVARDLPVFREVVGGYPHYFSTDTSSGLAEVIATWLTLPRQASAPAHWPTWTQSATALATAIRGTDSP